MTVTMLEITNSSVPIYDIFPMLHRYEVMPQVLRGIVIDRTLAQWEQSYPVFYSETERQQAIEQFWQQQQITSPTAQDTWLQKHFLTPSQLEELALRPLKLAQFKAQTWGGRVSSYFLKRKQDLDQVVYSLIRVKDAALANDLYRRISTAELTFEAAARQYSQGPEAASGGHLGPVSLSQPHPVIRKLFALNQPGELLPPQTIEGWSVIVRLEQYLPVTLDDSLQQKLIDELFELWLQEAMQSLKL